MFSVIFLDLPRNFDRDIDKWSTDIAVADSHTKDDIAWKYANLGNTNATDVLCDCHDTYKWEEATIFTIIEDNSSGRPVLMA